MKFIPTRDIPRLIAILFIALLFIFRIEINNYSNLALVFVTGVYVYITYELLRITRSNKNSPYLNVEYLIISDLKSNLFLKNETFVEKSQEYLVIKNDLESENPVPRNIVFVKIENTGDSVAIDIELNVEYSKKNFLEEHKKLHKNIPFQDLKRNEIAVKIFDVYEHPSANDYVEVTKCQIKFKDIALNNSGESPIKNDFSTRAAYSRDDGSTIVFKKVTP